MISIDESGIYEVLAALHPTKSSRYYPYRESTERLCNS